MRQLPHNRKTAVHGLGIVRSGALACGTLALLAGPAQTEATGVQAAEDLWALLSLAGTRVERFFARAQSLTCIETVVIQPLTTGFARGGLGRTVVSELRLTWSPGTNDPKTDAHIVRNVLRVNDRLPRTKDKDACTEPEQVETETQPLSMLLASERSKYRFALAGATRVDGRVATMVDFRELAPVSTDVRAVDGVEDCMSFEITGGRRGRLWIDRETADVLRLDHRLPGMVDLKVPEVLARKPGAAAFLTLEQSQTSIRFERITFHDPDEVLVLPVEATELRIMRGDRRRITTSYTEYARFLTDGRLVGGSVIP